MFDETAAVPLSSPVVIETGPQVDMNNLGELNNFEWNTNNTLFYYSELYVDY